jgi:Ca2+-binding EF-hand superfamily protein
MRSPIKAAFYLYCAMLSVALLAAMPIATLSAGRQPAAATPVFDLVDRNRDGFIDRREAGAVPGLAERFEQMDANHDGKLDRVEFARW